MGFWLAKTKKGAIPATDDDYKQYVKIAYGELIRAEIWDERYTKFHRKYFKMIDVAYTNMNERFADYIMSKKHLRQIILHDIGHVNLIKKANGEFITQVRSIDYKTVKQKEFEGIYSRSLDYIMANVLVNMDEAEFESKFMRFL